MEIDVDKYLKFLLDKLLKAKRHNIELQEHGQQRHRVRGGVYVFYENDKLVCAGETGDISSRMEDLLNTMNHQVRRNLGERHFSEVKGYEKPSSKKKFPEHIEVMLESHLTEKIQVSRLPVSLGRKELEEKICSIIDPELLLNNRGKRKNKKKTRIQVSNN
jgi:hypothetical protein